MKLDRFLKKQKVNFKNPWVIYFIFWVAVSFWCLLIIAAPVLSALGKKFLSGLIYLFFSPACHQLPERSFHILGKPFAVCSRCTGIYFGFWLTTTCYPWLSHWRFLSAPAPKWLLFALIPITADFAIQVFHILNNTFFSRTITGLVLGIVVALFILPGIARPGLKTQNESFPTNFKEKNYASKT